MKYLLISNQEYEERMKHRAKLLVVSCVLNCLMLILLAAATEALLKI